jgi:hypothetical protein
VTTTAGALSSTASDDPHKLRRRVLLIALFGTILRLALAEISQGTNDALIWEHLARRVGEVGLLETYRTDALMNHPPLPVLWARLAWAITGSGHPFSFVFKLPCIAADGAAVLLLAKIWTNTDSPGGGRRAARLACISMALNPVAILISGYHCNTDSIYAFLSLLGMYLLGAGRFFQAGAALAAAINIKLIPVLLVPAAISLCRTRRDIARLIAGLSIGVFPFIPLLLIPAARQHIFAYNPPVSEWGIAMILHAIFQVRSLSHSAHELMQLYLQVGRWIIPAAVVGLALVSISKRKWTAFQLGAMVFAMFLVLAPGFGPQYLVMIVPMLLAVTLTQSWIYALAAGTFLAMSYISRLVAYELPLRTLFPPNSPTPPGAIFGLMAWATLLYAFILIARKKKS